MWLWSEKQCVLSKEQTLSLNSVFTCLTLVCYISGTRLSTHGHLKTTFAPVVGYWASFSHFTDESMGVYKDVTASFT